jgi:hypothetical protein
MGYIHDTSMRYFVPPSLGGGSGGTWVHTLDGVHWYLQRNAVGGEFYLGIPVAVPQQSANTNRGSRVSSIDVYYSIYDADMTTLTPEFNLETLPASAEWGEPTNPTFTYDTGHDSNAERVVQGYHTMTLTLSTALWVEGGDYLRLDLYGAVGAAAIFRFWGAQIHYTLRI